ncbi:SufB/SufD family protein [Pseudoroseicyclus aestuarii]|uniref:Fe-S cluster assembly protein SufD n=1 Tax=Pseudoroseicyclus aestuarii TaxID=1795041 RepID=A0A318SZ59_9RHOB|nr:SufD family Fe-S cluster assembly protein [Pseudoroseicyclus aestuarii]PYE81294.1 Fe-S cluster assembly protein SufD [Pseudoroseicyclus aestuarii]
MVLPVRKTRKTDVKAEATEARLAPLTLPEGGSWSQGARKSALERLREMQLPGARDEYWRFTKPGPLLEPQVSALPLEEQDPVFDGVEAARIVFTDGRFDAEASDTDALEGVEIERLATAAGADIHWVRDLYGVLEAKDQARVERPFAALNTAFAADGVVIRVTGRAPRPVHLVYRREAEAADVMLHHIVKVEEGAEMTLLETGTGAARINTVLEVDVAKGATFHHVRSQGREHDRLVNTHVYARVAEEGVFKTFTCALNGRLTRNEVMVDMAGDDAVAHIASACLGDGKGFHDDDTVFVTHGAERGESRQVIKKVLRNAATGVFQGKILVQPGAQKTDGYQISQSLLLDEDAQFLAKPELEIYADDVQCSHGSTSGAIDEEGLFYLRSRGVPHDRAVELLVLAFVAEALDEIDDSDLASRLRDRLDGWLSRRR